MRTGLAAVGIGLGFHALFGKLEPTWLPRAIATMFILIGISVFYVAQKKGCEVVDRLNAHHSKPVQRVNLRVIAIVMSLASAALVVGLWMMQTSNE